MTGTIHGRSCVKYPAECFLALLDEAGQAFAPSGQGLLQHRASKRGTHRYRPFHIAFGELGQLHRAQRVLYSMPTEHVHRLVQPVVHLSLLPEILGQADKLHTPVDGGDVVKLIGLLDAFLLNILVETVHYMAMNPVQELFVIDAEYLLALFAKPIDYFVLFLLLLPLYLILYL